MRRAVVIGPCGAGKSTLARTLGNCFDLPVYHLDQLYWQPGWTKAGASELQEKVAAITATDRWLIDGNHDGSLAERLVGADTVVYLDFPIWLCILRLLKRIWRYRGDTRPDMAEGCPERFDLAFFLYLLKWNAGPRRRTEARLMHFPGEIVQLRGPRELDRWLASLSRVDESDRRDSVAA